MKLVKFFRTISFSILIFVLSMGVATATCTADRCINKIERIYLHPNGFLNVRTDGNQSALNCTLRDGEYLTLETSHSLFREYLAMLLTAKSSDLVSVIRIVGGSPRCEIDYIMLQ